MNRSTNHSASRLATIALAATLFAAATADAQRPTGRRAALTEDGKRTPLDERMTGLMLGAYTLAAPGVSMTGEDVDGTFSTSFGPGAGLMVGYGFNRTFAAYASLDVAKQGSGSSDYRGSFGLAHFEVGGRVNLPLGDAVTVPYVSASVGRRALGARITDEDGDEYDVTYSGGMFALGGGIQRVISPTLLLDGGVALGFGRFGHWDSDGDQGSLDVNGSTSIRLRFGVTWRPAGRRTT